MDQTDESEKLVHLVKQMSAELCTTFPEFKDKIEYWALLPDEAAEWTGVFIPHAVTVFPPLFFEIVFRSDELFLTCDAAPIYILPNVDFRELYNADQVGDDIRNTIWDYIHAILFEVIPLVQDKTQFGDAAQLFESMPDGELSQRIQSAFETNPFLQKGTESESPDLDTDTKNTTETNDPNIPNEDNSERTERFKQTLERLMGSKLGQLSRTLLAELKPEFAEMFPDLNMESDEDQSVAFQRLIKTPTKMFRLIKLAKQKMESKIKRGEISKDELMDDMTEMMKDETLKKEMADMMKNMGGFGGFNHPSVKTEMAKHAQRDRMRQKLDQKKQAAFFNGMGGTDAVDDENATELGSDAAEKAMRQAEMNISEMAGHSIRKPMSEAELEELIRACSDGDAKVAASTKAKSKKPKHKKR
jgi:hypothetical protein